MTPQWQVKDLLASSTATIVPPCSSAFAPIVNAANTAAATNTLRIAHLPDHGASTARRGILCTLVANICIGNRALKRDAGRVDAAQYRAAVPRLARWMGRGGRGSASTRGRPPAARAGWARP